MAVGYDHKVVKERAEKAFMAAMQDMDCAVIGYKNEVITLNRELAKERKRNERLEAKLRRLTSGRDVEEREE